MPKRAKVHYKQSHKCHYVNIKGIAHRLDPDYDTSVRLAEQLLGSSEPLVTDVLDKFIARHAKSSAATLRFNKCAVDSFSSWLKEKERGLAINQLQPMHVEDWLDDRHAFTRKPKKGGGFEQTDKPISDTYRANLIRPIKEAMKWFALRSGLKYVPLAGLQKPAPAAREHVLTEDQYKIVLQHAPDKIRDAIVCLWETGCRPQELRTVEARHYVKATDEDECDRWHFPWEEAKCGKKTKVDRIVPLNKAAREVTERLIEKWPEGPIFRNTRREAWTKDGFRLQFARLEESLQQLLQATLPKGKRKRVKINPYVFRHSFATRWADSDKIDSLHLAAAMGHRDSRMLDKVYAKIRNAKSIGKATKRMWGDDAA